MYFKSDSVKKKKKVIRIQKYMYEIMYLCSEQMQLLVTSRSNYLYV